ncbi:MAG TPA: hypothetical protein VK631_20230 [Solirubrobacteraceae bacterium]|nr:hypothetical protein [Solirubrobacteraceae bacterium]
MTLAIGIALSMVAITAGALIHPPFPQSLSNILATLFGATVGVVGTYLGAHGRGTRRQDDDRGDDREKEEP